MNTRSLSRPTWTLYIFFIIFFVFLSLYASVAADAEASKQNSNIPQAAMQQSKDPIPIPKKVNVKPKPVSSKQAANTVVITSPTDQTESPEDIDWTVVIGELMGGLSLFLFGVKLMSKSLKILAGAHLKELLGALATNHVIGLLSGIFVTTAVQSGTLVSVMVVEFVSSGFMTLSQSLGILLGAGIGSTSSSQMMAFSIKKYSLYLFTAGFGFVSLTKSSKMQQYGSVLMGMGLVFLGTDIMSRSVVPLGEYPPFLQFLIEVSAHPVLAVVISLVFTAMIQSSSATIGIVQVLGAQDMIGLNPALAMVLGSNVGAGMTAMIASLFGGEPSQSHLGSREAVRVAFANIFFKIVGVFITLPFLGAFGSLVEFCSPEGDLARQIANGHTLFNLFIAIAFLPLLERLAHFTQALIPDRNKRSVLRC